jgi:hypothetical protein
MHLLPRTHTHRYKEQKVGLRWRTQEEVASGKGQFMCGAKGCSTRQVGPSPAAQRAACFPCP